MTIRRRFVTELPFIRFGKSQSNSRIAIEQLSWQLTVWQIVANLMNGNLMTNILRIAIQPIGVLPFISTLPVVLRHQHRYIWSFQTEGAPCNCYHWQGKTSDRPQIAWSHCKLKGYTNTSAILEMIIRQIKATVGTWFHINIYQFISYTAKHHSIPVHPVCFNCWGIHLTQVRIILICIIDLVNLSHILHYEVTFT